MPWLKPQETFDYLENRITNVEIDYLKSDLDILKKMDLLVDRVLKLEEELAKCQNQTSKTE